MVLINGLSPEPPRTMDTYQASVFIPDDQIQFLSNFYRGAKLNISFAIPKESASEKPCSINVKLHKNTECEKKSKCSSVTDGRCRCCRCKSGETKLSNGRNSTRSKGSSSHENPRATDNSLTGSSIRCNKSFESTLDGIMNRRNNRPCKEKKFRGTLRVSGEWPKCEKKSGTKGFLDCKTCADSHLLKYVSGDDFKIGEKSQRENEALDNRSLEAPNHLRKKFNTSNACKGLDVGHHEYHLISAKTEVKLDESYKDDPNRDSSIGHSQGFCSGCGVLTCFTCKESTWACSCMKNASIFCNACVGSTSQEASE